jgi:hypothetical protein
MPNHFENYSNDKTNSAEIESIPEMSPEILVMKLNGIVSEENRAFLCELIEQGDEWEDVIGHVYGMILEEGGDPDEVLSELGVIER